MKTHVSLGMKYPFSDVFFDVLKKKNNVLIHCVFTGLYHIHSNAYDSYVFVLSLTPHVHSHVWYSYASKRD